MGAGGLLGAGESVYSAGSDDSSASVVPSGISGVSESTDSSLVGEADWVNVVSG